MLQSQEEVLEYPIYQSLSYLSFKLDFSRIDVD